MSADAVMGHDPKTSRYLRAERYNPFRLLSVRWALHFAQSA
jgi:hypothetical protein